MKDERPRRFFGLLCAHFWESVGTRNREWSNGQTQTHILCRCKHCGQLKVMP